MKQEYVVGFYFGPGRDRVLLIEKQRPKWQRLRRNGVGGHIEDNESAREAMVREFREETGLEIAGPRWELFARLEGADFIVWFFTATQVLGDGDSKQTTDETPIWTWVGELQDPHILPNLRWLIPMASQAIRPDWPYMIREKASDAA